MHEFHEVMKPSTLEKPIAEESFACLFEAVIQFLERFVVFHEPLFLFSHLVYGIRR